MSAEHGDKLALPGKVLRLGGIAWITAAAAGIITGASLVQLLVMGGLMSLSGSAIENWNKYFGKPHAAAPGGGNASANAPAGHH